MPRLRKALRWAGLTLLTLVLFGAVALAIAHEPRPVGSSGPEAEALASRIERAVSLQGWERTGAVRWTFAGRHEHLWDRRRQMARVRWGDTEALLWVGGLNGRAYRGGRSVRGEEGRQILREAHARWINDSFWLNPLAKLRDPGVSLQAVDVDGGQTGLLVRYSSGGLTPGDAYLWLLDDGGLPRAWRMWVSILPIGGVQTSWEGWITLSTGARIATRHRGPLGVTLELSEVEGAETLEELLSGAADPFAPLLRDEERSGSERPGV